MKRVFLFVIIATFFVLALFGCNSSKKRSSMKEYLIGTEWVYQLDASSSDPLTIILSFYEDTFEWRKVGEKGYIQGKYEIDEENHIRFSSLKYGKESLDNYMSLSGLFKPEDDAIMMTGDEDGETYNAIFRKIKSNEDLQSYTKSESKKEDISQDEKEKEDLKSIDEYMESLGYSLVGKAPSLYSFGLGDVYKDECWQYTIGNDWYVWAKALGAGNGAVYAVTNVKLGWKIRNYREFMYAVATVNIFAKDEDGKKHHFNSKISISSSLTLYFEF